MGGVFQTKMLAGFSGHDKKNLEETGKITNESIGNIRTVATLNKEIYFIEKYNQKIDVPHKFVDFTLVFFLKNTNLKILTEKEFVQLI